MAVPGLIDPAENIEKTTETTVAVPREVRERVSVSPPESWVKMREIDESFRHAASYSVILYDQQHDARGNAYFYREVRRLETRHALHALGQWRLDFNPRNQTLVVHSITVRREGSVTDHAQPDRFRFLQREGDMDYSLSIDGSITLLVLLEDVRVGDLIDVSYTIHTTPDFLRDRTWVYTNVPSGVALRDFHLSVRFPPDRAMQWKSNNKDFAPEISEENGETVWHWRKERVQPGEPEPNVPSWHFTGEWVQVTDCASWEEVASGFASAWHGETDTPELLAMVQEINAFASGTIDRVERAVTMVQDDIRYLSVNIDLGGQIPSSPSAVLKRRYGDCKDKSLLLAHLLRLLGVKACPVLVNTVLRQNVGQLLPVPNAFNHAIVKYEIDGKTRWVDATLFLQGGGALDRLVEDFQAGLPVAADSRGLEKIPPPSHKNERYELRETFALDSRPGHPSILNVSIKAAGWAAEELRRAFANLGQEEMARRRERSYKSFFSDLQRSGELQWEDDRLRNEFKLTESYDVLNAVIAQNDGENCVFYYPAHRIQSILGITQAGKRRHPYALPYPCNVEQTIEAFVTSIVSDRLPPPIIERGNTFRLVCENKRRGNAAIMTYSLATLTSNIPPQQFEAHKKAVEKALPSTNFYFQFPRGLPAPQRRKMPGQKIPRPAAVVIADEPVHSMLSSPKRKGPVSATYGPRSAKRRGSKREWKADAAPPEQTAWTKIVFIILAALILIFWGVFVFFLR